MALVHLLYRINTSEEETETTDASTCNLTPSSDIKLCNVMNKISPMKVITTVKLCGVDRLHLRIDYHSESIHISFLFKICLFLIYETFPHSSVYKKMHEARKKFCYKIPFILLMFCVFRYSYTKYIQINIYIRT